MKFVFLVFLVFFAQRVEIPGALSILPKFPVQPVEMQMGRGLMEIFRNKRTTFGGTPLFSSNRFERKLPFHFHFYCLQICSRLRQLLAPRSTNEITSFLPAWKKPFLLTRKLSGISNRRFWPNGKRSDIVWSLEV